MPVDPSPGRGPSDARGESPLDRELVARMRADLLAAGFTVDAVADRIGPAAAAALHREQALPAERVTRGAGDPVATLVRLFVLGRETAGDDVERALPSLGVSGARALGLLQDGETSDSVRAALDLRPYGDGTHDWWLASDLGELVTQAPLREDHVLGVGGASMTLAAWTPRPGARRVLDLGTGCGVQALHASTHAGEVVATDLSARAVELARLNAALNGVEWDVRQGSLFEPVAGERFDLIVSNPPFVITPRVEGVPVYDYRDGGLAADSLVRSVVRDVGQHLEPGGIACFLGNWEITATRDWRDVWTDWLDGTGLDAWVVQRETQDPAEYAELWIRDGGTSAATADFDRLYEAWLDDFAAREVTEIGFGVCVLQRPATERQPFRDLVEHSGPVASPMGPAVLQGIRARTYLAEHTDEEILDVAWQVADDVTEERYGRPGAEDPQVIQVRQGGGLGVTHRLGTAQAAYLSVCDGSLTARQALTAIAALLQRDSADVQAETLPLLRALVADGLLR